MRKLLFVLVSFIVILSYSLCDSKILPSNDLQLAEYEDEEDLLTTKSTKEKTKTKSTAKKSTTKAKA